MRRILREETGEQLLRAALPLSSIALLVCGGLTLLIGDPRRISGLLTGLARLFAARQDVPVACALILFFTLLRTRLANVAVPLLNRWQVVVLAAAMGLVAWGLRCLILFDFDLGLDEQMVAFDTQIFSQGRLFAPFPPEWREAYSALRVDFILPVGDRDGWVSAYLPGNAALRALFGRLVPDSLVSPLLVMVAGLALWRIARRIWPDSPRTPAVVLLLFAGSSQVILMGATRFAMTAHLAANLVWLWLFLQKRLAAHAGAIALGFLATGLHQPIFHPLFVAPFLDLLRRERRWGILSIYALGYAAIGLFWLSWPGWVSSHGLHPVPPEFQGGGVSYLDRLRLSVGSLGLTSFGLMGANLLRFFAWEHLLLLPLLLIGVRTAFLNDPLCRALSLGVVMLVLAMLVLMPAQGQGWGYRYLHGFIGSAVLVAGFGWRRLEGDGFVPAMAFRCATVLSVFVLLPVHTWMARKMIAPYAQASAAFSQTRADLLVVDDWGTPFGADLVRNRADLSNRPVLLLASGLLPETLVQLCMRRRTLAFADGTGFADIRRLFDVAPLTAPSLPQTRLHKAVTRTQCRVVASARRESGR